MIELKPHYSLIKVDNTEIEVVLEKGETPGSFKLPSNITFTKLKNHLIISIDIRYCDDFNELKAALLKNRFNIQGFIIGRINNEFWDIIYQYGCYKSYQVYINSEFIIEYN